jgi:AraC-like DNA-binding protein
VARAHFEESRPDLEPYGFTSEVWEPQPMRRADRHNELELTLLAAAVRGRARPGGASRALASAGGGAPTSVERMATFVARHYRDPVGLEDVAREVRLHPDYASALFRKAFGVTPTRFILQHRVSHAQRVLVTSDAKVLEVAMEAGFGSLSRFNSAFRQLCGCSPRQYRSRHRL